MTRWRALDLSTPRRIHLVGVGGAGMSGIARVLLQRGHDVSGSDLHDSRVLDVLRAMGARIAVGHDAAWLRDAEAVVYSSAVPDGNPELVEARSRGLLVLRRAELLAALARDHRSVLVAGSHGKTTTTSMAVVGLQAAGADPSFAIGGSLNEAGSNAHAGTGSLFVAEADESDRSFLAFVPHAALVTSVEFEHPDEFGSAEEYAAVFRAFLARRVEGGPAIVCLDEPGSAALAQEATQPVVAYGEDPRADVRLLVDELGARVTTREGTTVDLRLAIPGRYNLLNATGALAVCAWAGADLEAAAAGLASFTGPQRRFQRLGSAGGIEVVDDYAHNPTKLRAALAAARSVARGRVVVVVQPHRYSRTAVVAEQLGQAAAGADLVVVTEVYGAGEDPIPGVSGSRVARAARDAGATVSWQPHLGMVVDDLRALVRPGDLVLVTGAGDVTQVGPALLEALRSSGG